MFDRDLILDKFNSLHHQPRNLLLRFKTRVIECCADITTKLFNRRRQRGLALLPLLLLFELTQALFQSSAFLSNARAPFFEISEFNYAGLIGVNQSLAFSLKAGQSSFEPLLFLLLRRPIVGFLALIILIEQDPRVPQQFAHGLPDQLFNHFSLNRPVRAFCSGVVRFLVGAKIATNACRGNAGVAVHPQLTAAADQQAFEQIVKLLVIPRGAPFVSL